MARLLWLPEVLAGAGLKVHEVTGWERRGADSYGPVRGVTVHETRGSASSTDAGEIGVLVNGRPGLSGPIAQLYLSRTGTWHVVASGHCNHNKVGFAGPNKGFGNDALLGIEAQHAESEDWANKPDQYRSYVRGVAAILRHTGWAVAHVGGHKEHQPGEKTDPEFNMDRFRADVSAVLAGEDDDMAVGDDIYRLLHDGKRGEGKAETSGGGVPVAWIVREVGNIKAADANLGAKLDVLLEAVASLPDLDAKSIEAKLDDIDRKSAARDAALAAEVNEVASETVEALGAIESDAELAERLRAVLGDRAAAVGAILAAD